MIRLHITVEGDTEERFVNMILAPYLSNMNIFADARKVLTRKDKRAHREYRGGSSPYNRVKKDILNWLKEDNNPECRFTTMFDLYALESDFPSYSDAIKIDDGYEKVTLLEEALKSDICDYRFIPYIQLYEFEALVLSEPKNMEWEYMEHDKQIKRIIEIVASKHGNPELINCGYNTAPSKRILKEIPEYDKVIAGPNIIQKIGLDIVRMKCKHFNSWISELEKLNGNLKLDDSTKD
ncbi:MAG: DUF4276 family protein [Ruminiclostridium sp.]|nr:DUF4276 family protein [Ruminiclostridium sp.]